MLEFVISNYMIFVVIAIILLLGLFGYMMDRKKYEEYPSFIHFEYLALQLPLLSSSILLCRIVQKARTDT